MSDRGTLASFLSSIRTKISNLEHTSQLTLVNDPASKRVSDVLIKKTKPVTLYDTSLTFRDTEKHSK